MSAKGFDKNSIIGLVLIGAILLVFSIITKPSEEEVKAKEERDRLTKAKQEQLDKTQETETAINISDTSSAIAANDANNFSLPSQSLDSIKNIETLVKYGAFAKVAQGEEKSYVIENEKVKITISNKGGRLTSVELKEYHTYDSLPLYLFNKDSSRFNLELTTNDGIGGTKVINTENLFFETDNQSFKVEGGNSKSFSMKLYYGSKEKYLEYKYTLSGNSYLVDFKINSVGFNDVISRGFPYYLNWSMFTPTQEKTIKNQQNISTIYYQYSNGEFDYLSPMSYDKEKMETDVNWVMFKQQYFNSALIATEEPFDSDSEIETIEIPEGQSNNYVQGMSAFLTVPYNGGNNESFAMQYYFGPNKYDVLNDVGVGIENSIDFGWPVIKQVNKYVIRNVFKFLNNTGMNIGLTILLLTLIIKTLLFPITWKTYLSSAKMKVLKPEIAELTEKHGNDKVKKQQATMALYRQTGVNPLAGCIPMLIQMPILFALFRFFPATFDLRQKSFLWAEDLSTYDSIYDLGFNIPMYGDHISLFTLLMAISMIFYTKVNSQMTSGMGGDAGGAMASQMKMMTYLMPVMMLVFFNSYAAGLSFYYLIANVITILQQYAIRKWIVDEDKLRAKIQANKTKKKKKTGFAAKLEKRMKDAQTLQDQRKKKR